MNISGATKYIEFYEFETPDGVVYPINVNTMRFVYAATGEGIARSRIYTQQAPRQDGSTPINYSLEPRTITMTMRRNADNIYDHYDVRSELIDIFRLNRQTVIGGFAPSILKKKLPDGTLRNINVYLETGLLYEPKTENEWLGHSIVEVVRFICYDPIYYNPDARQEDLVFEAITGLLFPLAAPISFGGSGVQTDTISYNGDHKSYPVINITGPVRNPTIINLTTGKRIELNLIIAAGNTVTITITNISMTIVDAGGTSYIGSLTDNSDTDFAIVPAPLAVSGVNSLSLSGSSTNANTSFVLTYLERYQGF